MILDVWLKLVTKKPGYMEHYISVDKVGNRSPSMINSKGASFIYSTSCRSDNFVFECSQLSPIHLDYKHLYVSDLQKGVENYWAYTVKWRTTSRYDHM